MSGRRIGVVAAALFAGALAMIGLAPGCGSDSKELFTRPFDAGDEGDSSDELGPDVDPTLGGPCTEDAQCDDKIACTFDRCDKTVARCRNVPDDTACADPLYCNGKEKCVLRLGCQAGPVITCQDDNPCTIDRCIEATKSCEHKLRDVDGDGDPDDHCVAQKDCDDLDPTVSSTRAEICGNFKDDNCNGEVDEVGCVQPANDVCATALPVGASGTYLLSTIAAKKDYASSCGVTTPAASKDVVMKITVPGAPTDPPVDVEVWATAQDSTNEVAVALVTFNAPCAAITTELSCAHIKDSPAARTIARGLVPGTVLQAIVTTQTEGAVDAKVDIRPASPKPPNESCAAPADITVGVPFTVALIDPSTDVATLCDKGQTGELTYAFTLAQPQDVRIFSSTLVGSGVPVVSLRDVTCTDELRCRVGPTPPLFARNLSAGTHVLSVAGTRQIDASILVKTYPPTVAPPNQDCATATPIAQNATTVVDLSSQEDAIKNGCLPGGPAAAYDLTLTQASDVLIIGRFASNESGSVALNGPLCTTGDLLAPCATGQTPQRVSKRNVPAGSYRVVVADELGQTAQLSVLVRPTVPPTAVGASDNCVAPFTIPAAGGFFTGDTTSATADFNAGCDAPGQPIMGARDQIMRLDLAQQRRVVLDMSGSFYTTILDVRKGTTCPGVEVPDACYVGFDAGKSFLDLTLAAGTYWLQIDGYSSDRGPWNLDVRVLAP